jgi:hypothetical protein
MRELALLIVDEGKWLTLSLAVAVTAAAVLLVQRRGSATPVHRRITAVLNLVAGVTIACMAFGHLLAVATKLAMGTLRAGSLVAFLAIGLVLLVPSMLVAWHTRSVLSGPDQPRAATVWLNTWLVATLLALGLHNLPLAAPSLFTIGHWLHPRGVIGWSIVGAAAAVTIGLFAASIVFLASGQSFEQFRGLE